MRAATNRVEKNHKYHQILEAAVKVFARQGFHQSTVAQIAKAAGVADGTIYLYFKNKDDILVQFFSFRAKQVFERFREEVDRAQTSLDKLRKTFSWASPVELERRAIFTSDLYLSLKLTTSSTSSANCG